MGKGEIKLISRNQLFFSRNQPIKKNLSGACIISFSKMNQYMFLQECENFREKILGLGVILNKMSNLCLNIAKSVCHEINFSEEISL